MALKSKTCCPNSGTAPPPFDLGAWHSLELRFEGGQVTPLIDAQAVSPPVGVAATAGMVGLETGWNLGRFDNFAVLPRVPPAAMGGGSTAPSLSSRRAHLAAPPPLQRITGTFLDFAYDGRLKYANNVCAAAALRARPLLAHVARAAHTAACRVCR